MSCPPESLRLREIAYDPVGTALNVEVLAWIAGSGWQYERAAVLLGAAARLWRAAGANPAGFRPMAEHQRDCERQARQALGEQAFRAACEPSETTAVLTLRDEHSCPALVIARRRESAG